MAQPPDEDEENLIFNVEEVQKIVRDNIEFCLGGNTYSHSRCPQWISVITEKTLSRLNKLNKPFKYIIVDVLKETNSFFPETEKALEILFALPYTTCTVERSFSSLRRLKTWLRSTTAEDRPNGLAMMCVHRALLNKNLNNFNDKVVVSFAKNPRKLCFN